MGRVLVGAIIGVVLGGVLGSLAENLDAGFQLRHFTPTGSGSQTVSLTNIVRALGIIIGAGSGGIIGAMIGMLSAWPESRPLPSWFPWLILGLILLVALGAVLFLMMPADRPKDNPGPDRNQPHQVPAPPPGGQ